jgi:hypothetical protein
MAYESIGALMLDDPQSSAGIITKHSSQSVAETLDRLRRLIEDRGFTLFRVIDHSGTAERVGVQMPESKLVMFGKPTVGTSVMLAAPTIAARVGNMHADQAGDEDSEVEVTEHRLQDHGSTRGAANRQDISIPQSGQGREAEIRHEIHRDVCRDALLRGRRPPHRQTEAVRSQDVDQPVQAAPEVAHQEVDAERIAQGSHGHSLFSEDTEQDRHRRVEQKQRQQHHGHLAQTDRGNELPQPQGRQGWQPEEPGDQGLASIEPEHVDTAQRDRREEQLPEAAPDEGLGEPRPERDEDQQ